MCEEVAGMVFVIYILEDCLFVGAVCPLWLSKNMYEDHYDYLSINRNTCL